MTVRLSPSTRPASANPSIKPVRQLSREPCSANWPECRWCSFPRRPWRRWRWARISDSDHALQHRNTSCFLGCLPGRLVSRGKRGRWRIRKRPMFPKEHEAEKNNFRGATHIGQAGPLTPYHHTVQPDNGSASRPRLIRRKPVGERPSESPF